MYCDSNQINSLDVSLNDTLNLLDCSYNRLTELNLRNGNNAQLTGETTPLYPLYFNPDPGFNSTNNPDLSCIQVDDAVASSVYVDWTKDDIASYSEDCESFTFNSKINLKNNFKLYPNPAKNELLISKNPGLSEIESVLIADQMGRLIKTKILKSDINLLSIDVSEIETGIYFCIITTGNKLQIVKKWVKE